MPQFVTCKASSLFEHKMLFLSKYIVEDLLYNTLDILMALFFMVVIAFLTLDAILVVLQYGLYVIDIHSIWIFKVEVGLFSVWVNIMPLYCQNSIGASVQFSSKINSFHPDNLLSLFCCFNPGLKCIDQSLLNGLYSNILVQPLSEYVYELQHVGEPCLFCEDPEL